MNFYEFCDLMKKVYLSTQHPNSKILIKYQLRLMNGLENYIIKVQNIIDCEKICIKHFAETMGIHEILLK